MAAAGVGGELVGGQHPDSRDSTASCPVNRGVRIVKVDPHQSTEFDQDPRPQTIAIHNLESAVRPHLNATL